MPGARHAKHPARLSVNTQNTPTCPSRTGGWPSRAHASREAARRPLQRAGHSGLNPRHGWQLRFRPPTARHADAAALPQIAGNDWTIPSLRVVLLVGMVSSLVPTVLSFLFSDDRSLGAQSEGLLANHRKDQAEAGAAWGAPLVAGQGVECAHLMQL